MLIFYILANNVGRDKMGRIAKLNSIDFSPLTINQAFFFLEIKYIALEKLCDTLTVSSAKWSLL